MQFNLECIEVNQEHTRNQLKQFFLQTVHQKIYFSIFKCLRLDYKLIFIVILLIDLQK